MIFRGENIEATQKLLSDFELVKNQSLRAQVFPQYLVKDAMPQE